MAAINGTDLLVYITSGSTKVPIYCSTTCTLNINQETVDSTCKDTDQWGSVIEGKKSWDVSVDGLYQLDNDYGFVSISDFIVNTGTGYTNSLTLTFGQLTENFYWSGTAMLTSASLTGDDNTPASWSCSFTGIGQLTKTEV